MEQAGDMMKKWGEHYSSGFGGAPVFSYSRIGYYPHRVGHTVVPKTSLFHRLLLSLVSSSIFPFLLQDRIVLQSLPRP